MRPIKFRAWDRVANEMLHVESHQNCDRLKVSFSGTPFEENEVQPDLVLMQFTGLTDKNGKEIYEGDCGVFVGQFEKSWPMEVRWTDGKFVLRRGTDHKRLKNQVDLNVVLDGHQFEVIGNIYENPELLK
jgi:uncharacterized phage protein (TIGR01671 family)